MNRQMLLNFLLENSGALRLASPDIYSVIPEEAAGHAYDRTAKMYDLLVGNGFYNRTVWKNHPSQYAEYCRQALDTGSKGWVLDAGCGSLVFTAQAYLQNAKRPIVLLDRSLGMLQKARERLLKLNNDCIPSHILLLQGDVFALPFRSEVFETVVSWGLVHLFDNPTPVLQELNRVASPAGRLFLTSLVKTRGFANWYLGWLHKKGEVGAPMEAAALLERIAQIGLLPTHTIRGSMAYCRADKHCA